jgi:transcriptional regulator with XRE-family HTH domain
MSNMKPLAPLGQYIVQLCQKQNLSMREASSRSGLAPETISKILRRGESTRPRPQTLQAMADGLGGDFEHLMVLAGHLPAIAEGQDPEIERKARQLQALWREVRATAPEALERLMSLAVLQAEMLLIVAAPMGSRDGDRVGEDTQKYPDD